MSAAAKRADEPAGCAAAAAARFENLFREKIGTLAARAAATATTTRKRSRLADPTKALFYCHVAIFLVIASVSLAAGTARAPQSSTLSEAAPHTGQAHYSSSSASVQEAAHDAGPIQTVTSGRPAGEQQVVSHKSPLNGRQFGDTINDISIECNSHNIVVTLQTSSGFNGMIYPKGLSKNSTCMMEYHQLSSNITYHLPLRSCNTMSTDVEDGVEYFNTVMVQPHRRLVTNQGRGYHIRCRYQTKERTITNQEQQLSVNLTQSTPSVMGSASMPSCTMRIYSSSDLSHEVSAENVRIGDELHLVIGLDDQDVYGMLVTNCLVRDGMNWGEQPLIDDHGCPVDEEIMPEFSYAANLTRASVTFQAHKFPYTSSVYYQCNVRLCFRDSGGCAHVPPNCSAGAHNRQQAPFSNYKANDIPTGASHKQRSSARTRRWVDGGELEAVAARLPGEQPARLAGASGRDLSIEVSSGLHVDESELEPAGADSPTAAAAHADRDPLMMASTNDQPEETAAANGDQATPSDKQTREERQRSERDFCMSLRKFAIIVSLISLLLMTAIIIMIAWLIQRRNRQKLEDQMNSNYGQPHNHHHHHSNRAYCRD